MSTVAGDIVIDFFMGAGTTCTVAHKMKRQYIGMEQMNYVKDFSVNRLKKVIKGEKTVFLKRSIGKAEELLYMLN